MRRIAQVKPGGAVGDIGAAIQKSTEAQDSQLCVTVGHGVGRRFQPSIPHFGERGQVWLRPGMVFTIEPMINEGNWEVKFLADKWTVVTKDGKLSSSSSILLQ